MSGKKRPQPAAKPAAAPPAAKKSRARPTAGEQAAVKLALNLSDAARQPPVPPEEQLDIEDLLGLPLTPELDFVKRIDEAAGIKRGRPKGALNKRTVEWAEFLLTRYASPLEVLAQIANASVKDLVASLGCTKLEALQEKRLAAIALAPFLHSKQPVSVDVTNRNVVHLTINNTNQFTVGKGAGLTATVIDHKPKKTDAATDQP